MNEESLLISYHEYKGGNNRVIVPIWNSIKGATRLYTLYDASGCLTKDDFESAGIIGCQRGLDTYLPEGGSKITSWLIQLSNQSMLRQLKFIPTVKKDGERILTSIPLSRLDQHDSDDLKNAHFIDLLFSRISSSYEPTFIFDEFQDYIIKKTIKLLNNLNRRISRFLEFKLQHPEIDGPTCARMMKLNQTSYNKYMNVIRLTVSKILEEEA